MNGAQWYCLVNGQQNGPYTVEQFRSMAAGSPPPADMLVWTDGMAGWQPLASTPLGAALQGAVSHPAMNAAPPPAPAAGASIGFPDAVRLALTKFADFNGRATRPEFWYVWLFVLLLQIALGILEALIGAPASLLSTLAALILFVPLLAVAVRRLHDTDRSGWWYLLMFVPVIGIILLIVWWCQRGTPGRNRFG